MDVNPSPEEEESRSRQKGQSTQMEWPVPLARITTCGGLKLEVLQRARQGESDLPEPIYGPSDATLLAKKGASTALLLLALLASQPAGFATKDFLSEHLRHVSKNRDEEEDREGLKRVDNVVCDLRHLLFPPLPNESAQDRLLRRRLIAYQRASQQSGPGYQLAGLPLVWLDVEAIGAHIQRAKALEQFGEDGLAEWRAAYALASQGPFLPGECYSDWASARREAIEGHLWDCVQVLWRLVVEQGEAGQIEAIGLLRRYWQAHKSNEDALRPLLELLGKRECFGEAETYYQQFCREMEEEGKQPDRRTREVMEFLRALQIQRKRRTPPPSPLPALPVIEAKNTSVPANREMLVQQGGPAFLVPARFPIGVWEGRHPHQELDLLCAAPDALPALQHLGTWLTLGVSDLAVLFEAGWTTEGVLDVLRLLLQTIQHMPPRVRQHLLQVSSATLMRGIPLPTGEALSSEEQLHLCLSLGQGIGESWKLFSRASMPQVLALGQAQQAFLQHVCSWLPFPTRAILFSAVYRLIGAALFFQARYPEALKAHEQAYLAALEAGDAWNMAESLGWQSGVWKACGQQREAIALTEAALRLLSTQITPQAVTTQARLLAQWAESAALLHLPAVVEEKLGTAVALFDRMAPNEEFDRSIWLYYNGTCAFYLGDFSQADTSFEQALQGHHPTWRHQRAITTLFRAQARLHLKDVEGSLRYAQMALPLLAEVNAALLQRGLLDYAESLCCAFPGHPEADDFLKSLQPHRVQLLERPIPRYLEATL